MLDQLRFLASLVRRPRMTGAIAPSGPALAKRMASHVDPNDTLPVIELGPGTGVVTKALIERGVKPSRIISIEYSPDFCRLLRQRFPGVTVIEGDFSRAEPALPGPFDVVIHSAATVSFDPPIDDAFQTNLLGAQNLYRGVLAGGSTPHFVHISTAYVAGVQKGVIPEGPLDHRVDHMLESDLAMHARRDAPSCTRASARR
ncbi:MAG: SDR family oxidoreductase, partial [Cucumibacter sp.]